MAPSSSTHYKPVLPPRGLSRTVAGGGGQGGGSGGAASRCGGSRGWFTARVAEVLMR